MITSRVREVEPRLAEFYDHRGGGPLVDREYLVVLGDDIAYFLDGDADSRAFLAEIIDEGSIGRGLAAGLVRWAHHVDRLLSMLPNVERRTLRVPADAAPDVVVLRSRLSVVEFERDAVYKFPLEADGEMDAAVEVRRRLPAEIRTPALLEVDREFPYICEEFVHGRTVRDSLDSWPHILAALQNLTHLYRDCELRYVPVDEVVERCQRGTDDPFVERAGRVLDDLPLPDELAVGRIHGDLAVRNLRYDDSDVYVFDWQDSRRDLLVEDFFRPLHRIASKTDDPRIFAGMIAGAGTPHRIANEYASQIGPLAFGDHEFPEGLPLLYLLRTVEFETDWRSGWQGRTLAALVDELESNGRAGLRGW